MAALYDRYRQALAANEVYKSWMPGGVERGRAETIRALIATTPCRPLFDHRSSAEEAAEALRQLRDLLHDGEHPLCEYGAYLLPPRYFPYQINGCGHALCGDVTCGPNQHQWRRLCSAVAFYQRSERQYPSFNGLFVANPRKEINRLNVNDYTQGDFWTF